MTTHKQRPDAMSQNNAPIHTEVSSPNGASHASASAEYLAGRPGSNSSPEEQNMQDRYAPNAGCCGKPKACTIDSAACPWMNHKRRTMRVAATLPKCAVCGGGEKATQHVATCHPEHHNFTEVKSA